MPAGVLRDGRTVRVVQGDITALDVDAFVFAARPDLELGSGYGNAIAVRGGPGIREELKKLAPVVVGQAVATSGGNLAAKWVIHAVGPRFSESGEEDKLRSATRAALRRAEEKGVRRLALPALGYGFYGVPAELCAKVMVGALAEHFAGGSGLEEVIFCLRDTREMPAFEKELPALSGEGRRP
jgi:O-acetyl-ADP-ribose deacetylase (regulator of RNase III)